MPIWVAEGGELMGVMECWSNGVPEWRDGRMMSGFIDPTIPVFESSHLPIVRHSTFVIWPSFACPVGFLPLEIRRLFHRGRSKFHVMEISNWGHLSFVFALSIRLVRRCLASSLLLATSSDSSMISRPRISSKISSSETRPERPPYSSMTTKRC